MPTREILWNVPGWAEGLLYALFVVALAIFARGARARIRAWRRGRAADPARRDPDAAGGPGAAERYGVGARLRRVLREAVVQATIWRSPLAGASHLGVSSGFVVLFAGTCIVAAEDWGAWLTGREHLFFVGSFYLAVSCALEVFGLAFLAGLVLALLRRRLDRRRPPLDRPVDRGIAWLLIALGVSGFALEALRIAGVEGGREAQEFERWSFVGWWLAGLVEGAGASVLRGAHLGTWLAHAALTMVFIAMLPYCKLRHILLAPVSLAIAPPRQSGRLRGVSLADVEESGEYGASRAGHFTRSALLSFDACTECARCQTACPAHATGKPLSPMRIVLDIAARARTDAELHDADGAISEEALWACTTCGACVHECPVAIDQLGAIVDLRRHLVGEGSVRGGAKAALRSMEASANPWGLPASERMDWADGLDVPVADGSGDVELLYWVGCAASLDRRARRVARAMVEILRAAGVEFAVLGKKEKCTGDPARRLGDEFTFRALADQNIETLREASPRRIVASCPHCFNALRREYPDLGATFEVVHHTQLIAELVRDGRLPSLRGETSRRVTFHDPCYLGRHGDELDAPRAVIAAAGESVVEPSASGRDALCCGAGGGRMWLEEETGERIADRRWGQLSAARADVVAVGCPFCATMLTDAGASSSSAETEVLDVAEIYAERLRARRSE